MATKIDLTDLGGGIADLPSDSDSKTKKESRSGSDRRTATPRRPAFPPLPQNESVVIFWTRTRCAGCASTYEGPRDGFHPAYLKTPTRNGRGYDYHPVTSDTPVRHLPHETILREQSTPCCPACAPSRPDLGNEIEAAVGRPATLEHSSPDDPQQDLFAAAPPGADPSDSEPEDEQAQDTLSLDDLMAQEASMNDEEGDEQ